MRVGVEAVRKAVPVSIVPESGPRTEISTSTCSPRTPGFRKASLTSILISFL